MLKIGDFAKLSNISINMLRHYNDIGLLNPIKIDSITGYRYYNPSQIPIAYQIQLLKKMGFALEDIKNIICNIDDKILLKNKLLDQYNDLVDKQQIINKQINLINNTLSNFNNNNPIEYSVILKELPAMKVVSTRGVIKDYNQEGILWEKLSDKLSDLKVIYAKNSLDIAIVHDCDEIEVEVLKSIESNHSSFDDIIFKNIPSIEVLAIAYNGEYERLPLIYNEIAKWISVNNYELSGPVMNIYHLSPKTISISKEYITEVCFPVKIKVV